MDFKIVVQCFVDMSFQSPSLYEITKRFFIHGLEINKQVKKKDKGKERKRKRKKERKEKKERKKQINDR